MPVWMLLLVLGAGDPEAIAPGPAFGITQFEPLHAAARAHPCPAAPWPCPPNPAPPPKGCKHYTYLLYRGNYFCGTCFDYRRNLDYPWHSAAPAGAIARPLPPPPAMPPQEPTLAPLEPSAARAKIKRWF